MTLLALNLYLSRHDFRDMWKWMKRRSRPLLTREAANNITSEEKSEYDMDDEEDFGDIDDEDLDADYGYSKPEPLKTVSERWIVIKACSDPMMWYARQIARHYKVERECLDYYWVKENGTGPINIVHKQDASLYLQKKLI